MFVAISTGPTTHLDHLAPLCYLLEIPLIVTEPEHEGLGKKFYPMVAFQYISLEDLTLDYIAHHFDAIITCGKFWAMQLQPLLEMLYGKQIRFIFSPHGNSDKEAMLGLPVSQDIDLIYGPQMRKEKSGGEVIEIGNIRYWFYKKHQAHFDALTKDLFREEKKTVLYAPTWETKATSTSFFEKAGEIILTHCESYNLLIKLHPLLEENDPAAFHRIIGMYEHQARFILDFPPIYPILEKTDIYLGDFSSIGYDFLAYDRPMFFLKKGGRLQRCGEVYEGGLTNAQEELSDARKQMYEEAFAKYEGEKIKALLLQGLGKSYSSP